MARGENYEVYIKRGGGWSSIDTLDAIAGRAPTKEEYIKLLKDDGETALIKVIEEAEGFKIVKE